VFVHGLTGDGENTWKKSGAEAPWPKTLLHDALPQARIMTYSYDADIANLGQPAGNNRIAEHARNLNGDLEEKRDALADASRPIVFVAHSLGGLVVKNALFLSNTSPQTATQNILNCTRGLVFMGTPHCGADAAKFLQCVTNLARVFVQVNTPIVAVLKRNSEVLWNLTTGFNEMIESRRGAGHPEIEIVCFYEELATQRLRVSHTIVPMDSAIIPGKPHFSIYANHVDMTKFSATTDDGYSRVQYQINKCCRPAQPPTPSAAAATMAHWTAGTNSGPVIQQSNNRVSRNDIRSERDVNFGNTRFG